MTCHQVRKVVLCHYIFKLKESEGTKQQYHKFGFRIGGNQSDWLVTKAQVHQCRVEHKHNIEPWIVIENPLGILTKAQVHQCRVEHKHNIEPWIVIENPLGILTKAQVHQCRVEHKHNIEPWIVIENPIEIPFNKKKKKQYS